MPKPNLISCHRAATSSDYQIARDLFVAYENELDFKINFQGFKNEIQNLANIYGAPQGAIFIAYKNKTPLGCIALRKLNAKTGEIKRMYVKPAYRNCHVGRRLLETIMEEGRLLGYEKVRLDTLKKMKPAVRLYQSVGFYDIEAYRFNPFEDALFLEKIV